MCIRDRGIGNFLCGLLGAIPMTAVVVRGSANIQAGAKTKVSAFVHGLFLLLSVLLIPFLINMIPYASLSAILIITGFGLTRIEIYKNLFKLGLKPVSYTHLDVYKRQVSYLNNPENWTMIERLKSYGVQLEKGENTTEVLSNVLENKTFLFTGKLSLFTREQAEEMVEKHGGKNISAVSKNLNYLVVGEKAGSKLKKAQDIGTIEILDEKQFLDLIEN